MQSKVDISDSLRLCMQPVVSSTHRTYGREYHEGCENKKLIKLTLERPTFLVLRELHKSEWLQEIQKRNFIKFNETIQDRFCDGITSIKNQIHNKHSSNNMQLNDHICHSNSQCFWGFQKYVDTESVTSNDKERSTINLY